MISFKNAGEKPPLQSGHILLFWFHYGFPQVVAIPKIRFFTVCILKRTPFLNGPIDMTNFDFQIRQSMSFLRKQQSPFVDFSRIFRSSTAFSADLFRLRLRKVLKPLRIICLKFEARITITILCIRVSNLSRSSASGSLN
jgi:hypothetical protein